MRISLVTVVSPPRLVTLVFLRTVEAEEDVCWRVWVEAELEVEEVLDDEVVEEPEGLLLTVLPEVLPEADEVVRRAVLPVPEVEPLRTCDELLPELPFVFELEVVAELP